jgi:hypothetical protein
MPRYELNIAKLEKDPAPPIPDWFRRELERLLPLNPYGEPQLTVGWGGDLTCFRNDDPRAIKYIAVHELIKTTKWRRLDPIAAAYEYFDTRQEAVDALNIRLLPHLEYKVARSVRLWGPPRFIVEQWMPPERIDSQRNWERNRLASYLNRRGEKISFDALGAYPTRGQYREVFMVEDAEGGYRELDNSVMSEIRRRVHEREIYGYNDHTDAHEIREMLAEDQAATATEEAQIEDEFIHGHLGASKYRLVEGNAFLGGGGNSASQARALKP